jgi:hypothetical protein
MVTLIRSQFFGDLQNWISRLPKAQETWSAELQTLEGHSLSVASVAFSRDGVMAGCWHQAPMIKL